MTEPAEKLREEIAELRRELAELQALLRASLARRRSPKKITTAPAAPAPEVRKSVRDKMVRSAARKR